MALAPRLVALLLLISMGRCARSDRAGPRDGAFIDRDGSGLAPSRFGRLLGHLANRFELVWASSWEDNENLVLASALGLPTLPVVRFAVPTREAPGGRHDRRTWQLPSVVRFVGDRPS